MLALATVLRSLRDDFILFDPASSLESLGNIDPINAVVNLYVSIRHWDALRYRRDVLFTLDPALSQRYGLDLGAVVSRLLLLLADSDHWNDPDCDMCIDMQDCVISSRFPLDSIIVLACSSCQWCDAPHAMDCTLTDDEEFWLSTLLTYTRSVILLSAYALFRLVNITQPDIKIGRYDGSPWDTSQLSQAHTMFCA